MNDKITVTLATAKRNQVNRKEQNGDYKTTHANGITYHQSTGKINYGTSRSHKDSETCSICKNDYEISNSDYARGIEVVDSYPLKDSKLGKNEYFALMVTDLENKNKRPRSDYVDFTKGYIGFERTSDGRIYISKDFRRRHDEYRGKTLMVKVSPDAKVTELEK